MLLSQCSTDSHLTTVACRHSWRNSNWKPFKCTSTWRLDEGLFWQGKPFPQLCLKVTTWLAFSITCQSFRWLSVCVRVCARNVCMCVRKFPWKLKRCTINPTHVRNATCSEHYSDALSCIRDTFTVLLEVFAEGVFCECEKCQMTS